MGVGGCAPTPSQGHRGGSRTCLFLFHVENHVYCSPESKHFAKWLRVHPPGLMKPHSKSLFTQWQHQSLVASPSWDQSVHSASPDLSLVLGDGQVIPQASRLVAGVRLWNSKAQKVQMGLAFLCLTSSPTTLLPSSSVRCSSLQGGSWMRGGRTRGL